ncbi:MAG: hypothetical protein US54_C0078G0004 [Candidatus Roizmanbacteria bacterium GW2011_GWA2_37_7]|uniref:Antitoxin n=1 Tax=Candidatus Roizmanbacteria bacterium GW2011_GWA2_37_7 TaxID=1618481 RepID=A0A0G0GYZ2_9BACT|nr:MAG: hypothetical protein US54_C0078G0004 [Candidatus Roizmanbacteria bacterium GW2011_GWA2_37_7]
MNKQFVNYEKFTNIQNAQAGLTRLFIDAEKTSSYYRVLKNDQALGVLLPDSLWKSLTEDIEALSSPNYRAKIAQARRQKKHISSSTIKKQLGL